MIKKKKAVRKTKKPIKLKSKKILKRTNVKSAKPKARKVVRKPAKKLKGKIVKSFESTLEKIGEVTHYFPHVKAAAVKLLKSGLKIGDEIYIKGHTTDFKEKVQSIQLDHEPIAQAKKGQEIGLMVKSRVRIGDRVYGL